MALKLLSPKLMDEYRQKLLLFAKGSPSLSCKSAHLFEEMNGLCDLTGRDDCEVLFVLANRSHQTIKVDEKALAIVANVLDLQDLAPWTERIKEQRKALKERFVKKEDANVAPKVVVRRRPGTVSLR